MNPNSSKKLKHQMRKMKIIFIISTFIKVDMINSNQNIVYSDFESG